MIDIRYNIEVGWLKKQQKSINSFFSQDSLLLGWDTTNQKISRSLSQVGLLSGWVISQIF